MPNLPFILVVLAFVFALLAAVNTTSPRFNLLGASLACYFLAELLG